MNVNKLEGAKLDYWVARALGWQHLGAVGVNYENKDKPWCLSTGNDWWQAPGDKYPTCGPCHGIPYAYSTDWALGGPILEKRGMRVQPVESDTGRWWHAECWRPYGEAKGPTPLVAAMRALVASEIGETVPASGTEAPQDQKERPE